MLRGNVFSLDLRITNFEQDFLDRWKRDTPSKTEDWRSVGFDIWSCLVPECLLASDKTASDAYGPCRRSASLHFQFSDTNFCLDTLHEHHVRAPDWKPSDANTQRCNAVLCVSCALSVQSCHFVWTCERNGRRGICFRFFAADMAALVLILAFFIHELAVEEKRLIARELMQPYRRVRNSMVISTFLFLFTMVPVFWDWRIMDVPLRFYLWLIPIAIFWIGRLPEKPE